MQKLWMCQSVCEQNVCVTVEYVHIHTITSMCTRVIVTSRQNESETFFFEKAMNTSEWTPCSPVCECVQTLYACKSVRKRSMRGRVCANALCVQESSVCTRRTYHSFSLFLVHVYSVYKKETQSLVTSFCFWYT